jgi:hypothetical protein
VHGIAPSMTELKGPAVYAGTRLITTSRHVDSRVSFYLPVSGWSSNLRDRSPIRFTMGWQRTEKGWVNKLLSE